MSLTSFQKKAIRLLMEGMKWEEIAAETGIRLQTLHEWRSDSDFIKALSQALDGVLDEQKYRLVLLLPLAIDKLKETLNGSAETSRMKAIELVAKWTGLAAGNGERTEPAEGGFALDEIVKRTRDCRTILEQET